ncbi:hypothetical protein M9H77_12768 [Catharanthus roseus]|uniref:Uncharacterized protein n=1 Tax=Catharanthus roseus TaxID=4058 RepID=A0ACC0BIG0_CATRO|nr:hypothetical protein M9H77_12768 [Catharanthus roseus]
MPNFHHGAGNGVKAYGGNNYGNGNFIPRRHVGHTSYDDYGGCGRVNTRYNNYEHNPYDCYEGYHYSCVAKVEIMKSSMIGEFSKVNKLLQAKIEVEESVVLHLKEEISNGEHCDLMRDKNIEKESIENKEKERVEEKERLLERLCIVDSISIFLKESEHLECSKEKESGLGKSERVKENECFIENKRIVVLEMSEEMNFYANDTNSFFASDSLCVQNFEDSSKDE